MTVPAYMLIRQYAVDLVMRSPEREVRIQSERELCKTFGVTRPTVRKALKDLIEDDFLLIRPGLGTFTNPQKALKAFTPFLEAFSAGIIIGDAKHVSYGGFFGGIMLGALNYIISKGGYFRIINIIHKGMKAVENILLLNVDRIIWLNPPENMLDIINGLERRGIPVAIINRFPKCDSTLYIGMDYEHEGYIAAKQFIERGHRNVLIVINGKLHSDLERLQGFKKAFRDEGLTLNKDLILETGKDIELKLQTLIDADFKGITGFYALKYEALKALEAFNSIKRKPNEKHMIIALEYIMWLKPEIKCFKAIEPLVETGILAAKKLSEKIQGKLTGKTIIKLKPEIK